MNLRSRSEQIADHLRGCFARGEMTEPLPGTRAWAEKLGVSPTTLKAVLKILQREGLVVIQPRRPIRLGSRRAKLPHSQLGLVRIVYYGAEYPSRSLLPWFPLLSERLSEHGIHAALESCALARLRALAGQDPANSELLVLASIPAEYQDLFTTLRHRALIAGQPSPNTPLSFVNADVDGTVQHATNELLQRGLTHLSLVLGAGRAQGLQRAIDAFERTCRAWHQQPLRTELVQSDMTYESEARMIQRFAARVHPPQGILVLDPVPATMMINALLERGISLRHGIEIRSLLTWPWPLPVCHPPPCYPYPLEQMVKHKLQTILRYFESGTMPEVRITVPVLPVPNPW